MPEEKKELAEETAEPALDEREETISESDVGGSDSPAAEEGKAGEEAETKEAKPAKQSRKDNAYYAELRRARQAEEERKRKAEIQRAREQAALEERAKHVKREETSALGIEKAESEDELFLVDAYREGQEKGYDNPIAYAYRKLSEKQSEQISDMRRESEEAKQRSDAVTKDAQDFASKFGKPLLQVLQQDKGFTKFFDKYGSQGHATDCYADYLALIGGDKAGAKAEEEAKRNGSFPFVSGGNPKAAARRETDEEFLTRVKKTYGENF